MSNNDITKLLYVLDVALSLATVQANLIPIAREIGQLIQQLHNENRTAASYEWKRLYNMALDSNADLAAAIAAQQGISHANT